MSIVSEISRLQSAKASIKTAIEGQGVTVPSSTTLDGYATLIDSISGGGGGSVENASGTFTGDGTISAVLNIGFKPDLIVIKSNLDGATAGWTGLGMVAIIKNVLTLNIRHNNDTAVAYSEQINEKAGGNYPPYGADNVSYGIYGTYLNGMMTVTNPSNTPIMKFINGQTYNWEAVKYTSDS